MKLIETKIPNVYGVKVPSDAYDFEIEHGTNKFLIDESVNIHQSLSTPKKLCIDILNPKLKELLEVKNHIEKL